MMNLFQQEDFISKNLQREINAEERENAITNLIASVFTSEWRTAVIRFAERIPVDLLIQEFNQCYIVPDNKRITSDETKEKGNNSSRPPPEILENVFLRNPLEDLLTCRSVCDAWNKVYESKLFQAQYQRTLMNQRSERCIVGF
jgi:hypothetical protein